MRCNDCTFIINQNCSIVCCKSSIYNTGNWERWPLIELTWMSCTCSFDQFIHHKPHNTCPLTLQLHRTHIKCLELIRMAVDPFGGSWRLSADCGAFVLQFSHARLSFDSLDIMYSAEVISPEQCSVNVKGRSLFVFWYQMSRSDIPNEAIWWAMMAVPSRERQRTCTAPSRLAKSSVCHVTQWWAWVRV
jgi:hypothetical protein